MNRGYYFLHSANLPRWDWSSSCSGFHCLTGSREFSRLLPGESWDGGDTKQPRSCASVRMPCSLLAGEVRPPLKPNLTVEDKSDICCFQTGKSGTLWDHQSESRRILLNAGNICWIRILQLVSVFNPKLLLLSPSSAHSSAESHWPLTPSMLSLIFHPREITGEWRCQLGASGTLKLLTWLTYTRGGNKKLSIAVPSVRICLVSAQNQPKTDTVVISS